MSDLSDDLPPIHYYHAETTILAGRLILPVEHEIKPQAYAALREVGGYVPQRSHGYRIDSFLSLYTGYTQASGHGATTPSDGSVTYTTAVAENLNISDVVTADRIVAQAFTIHPHGHNVPTTHFLGTRFEGLRIAGHLVDVKLDLNIMGSKPPNDDSYLTNQDFLDRAALQHREVRRHSDLPADILARYNQIPTRVETPGGIQETIECSLVNEAKCEEPFRFFGHVIHIRNFGVLTLARLRHNVTTPRPELAARAATSSSESGEPQPKTETHLTMLDLNLNTSNQGHIRCCEMILNGGGKKNPPPPPPGGTPPTR